MQETLLDFSVEALFKAKEDLFAMAQDDDSEEHENMESMRAIEPNSSEAYIAACAVVMVCDNELDESELTELIKTAIKSKLMIKVVETLGQNIKEIEGSLTDLTAEDYKNVMSQLETANQEESDDVEDEFNTLLEEFDAQAALAVIAKVKSAWGEAQESDGEYELLDILADKIGPELSSFVLSSCLDIAKVDGSLQDEEQFVLSHLASKWGQEDYLCTILHALTDRSWSMLTVAGRQILIPSDDEEEVEEDVREKQPVVSELWQAILTNEGQKAIELIQGGVPVNEMIDFNSEVCDISPLMVAAEKFDEKLVKALIDAGADINAKACVGYVPLTWALKGENLDNFRLLLAASANPDPLESGEGDFSPLSMAARHGLVVAVKELIGLGVNVNWVSENGADALKSAVVHGNMACVELLLDAGANPASFDNEGFSPIHNAADEGHHDVVRRLLDAGVDVDLRVQGSSEDEGTTVLHRACSKGDLGLVRILVERGGNVNTVAADFSIPLSAAITDGAENSEDASDLILYLIKQGAEPDIRTLLISMQTKLPVPIFSIMLKKLLPEMDSPLPFESGEIEKDDIVKAFSYFLSEETDMRRRNDIQKILEDAGLDILPMKEGDGDIS